MENKRKIGILTLPLHTNYGGILQAWALQTVLEGMGHDVEIISRRYPLFDYGWRNSLLTLYWVKRFLYKLLRNRKVHVFAEQHSRKQQRIVRQNIYRFFREHMHIRRCLHIKELKRGQYDAFVVGGDQIWRADYQTMLWPDWGYQDAFLGFARNWDIKRLSYSASFGFDRWGYTVEETARIKDLLEVFDAVMVREDSGKQMLKEHTGIEAEHVLDPAMLLTKEDYLRLVADKGETKEQIVTYILDSSPGKEEVIRCIAGNLELPVCELNHESAACEEMSRTGVIPSIESWLWNMANARIVVTDSFHGCVFALIFGRPLAILSNHVRGNARMESLIRMFGLEGHVVNSVDSVNQDFDYSLAYDISGRIQSRRKESLSLLQKSLP